MKHGQTVHDDGMAHQLAALNKAKAKEISAAARSSLEQIEQQLPIQWMSDIKPRLSNQWLIKGLLPQMGIALIYGPSGSGKTFLACDIAAHVAAGIDWGARRTHHGVVIYIAAESPSSLFNRASLWREHYAPGSNMPFGIIPKTLNLKDPSADLPQLIEWLQIITAEHGPIAAIFVDTLARSMGNGDENLARDMGGLISSCDRLREEFATLVVLVHHTGKNTDAGARGSSSLRAGVDTEIEITDDHGLHRAIWQKQRDGEIGFHYQFRLESFPIGEDEDGEQVTSCLVTDLEYCGEDSTRRQKKLSSAQQIALKELHDLLDGPCGVASSKAMNAGAKVEQAVVSLDAWRELCFSRDISDKSSDAKRMAFKRAAEKLQAIGKVQVFHDEVWLAD
jgi:hypothetical protein